MTDQTEHLILEYLRAMRGDITGIKEGVNELFVRVVSMESHLARIDLHLARSSGEVFHTHARVDAL